VKGCADAEPELCTTWKPLLTAVKLPVTLKKTPFSDWTVVVVIVMFAANE
jgi:hypothetical protein